MERLGRLRRLFLDVHLWIGAGLAVALIPLGLSGSLLVYQSSLQRLLTPQRYEVSPGALLVPSAYLGAAQAKEPGLAPAQIRYPARAGDPAVVILRAAKDPRGFVSVYLDPATAKVLDAAPARSGLLGAVHAFHESLFIAGVGRKMVGCLGLAMTISCLTGIYLWWPRGPVLKGLRWHRSASLLANLHHRAGILLVVPLAVLCVTGVYISFPQTARSLTAGLAPGSSERGAGPRGGAPLSHPKQTPDAALAAATALVPDTAPLSLRLPLRVRQGEPTWQIVLKQAGAGEQSVDVGDETGIARVGVAGAAGDPMASFVHRLHEGEGLGPVWRALVFVTGLAPTLFAVTGILMWQRRRRRRLALHPRAARPATT